MKVIASDAGVTACHNGGTHMSFEDMGIVRGLAHSVVLEVTDAVMFEDILRQLIDLDGFYWVRTIRKQAPSVYARVQRLPSAKAMSCAKEATLP